MTVKELIEQLSTLDPEMQVFTAGYEGGFESVENINSIEDIVLNYNEEWYYGPHESLDKVSEPKDYNTVKGLIL
jgi:hypothetical protein